MSLGRPGQLSGDGLPEPSRIVSVRAGVDLGPAPFRVTEQHGRAVMEPASPSATLQVGEVRERVQEIVAKAEHATWERMHGQLVDARSKQVAAEAERDRLAELGRQVLGDHGELCDHPATCECSAARLARELAYQADRPGRSS